MDVFFSFSPPPFCSFSWEGFCFLYPFFSRVEIFPWRPAIQRPEPENIGFSVCSPKTRSVEPSLPQRKWPSFLSLVEAFVILSFLLNIRPGVLAERREPKGQKKKQNHFWLRDLLGGVGKATSPYHFWLEERDLFRWTKMDGGIVLDYFLVKNSPHQFWFRNLLRSVYRACPK